MGRGFINEVKIPVQEFGGQRGEGAHFRENTVVINGFLNLTYNQIWNRTRSNQAPIQSSLGTRAGIESDPIQPAQESRKPEARCYRV